ncbi:outer membrane lipoprotein-sorting protein [uncultured Proteiniphilum sp.]|uniref:outer membrane lipoprotein-sorting protein n=1 Tax=uncultured Proteiniphilum sp. TaxID=497637 RepID=UPI00261DAFD8|nr:outer membrane lipoprotein-sorting protein [uncultured Proteiniphilum sp.]
MRKLIVLLFIIAFTVSVSAQDAEQIIQEVDKNISAKSQIAESTMTVPGKRNSRTMTAKSYTIGDEKSFTEYLSPPREKGTKMLKLDKEMWVYSPSTDRTIMISGHMLRQSVMGSDLSYEDMMEDRKLTEMYTPSLAGEETIEGRKCYVITLTAKVNDVAYHSQKMWVDTERFVPLKQELYAKSGQLLKQIRLSDIKRIQNRWFPMKMVYQDMLKDGKGTEYNITHIEFDKDIPANVFSKASLKQ